MNLINIPAKKVATILLAIVASTSALLVIALVFRVNFWLEIYGVYAPQILIFNFALMMMLFAVTINVAIEKTWKEIFTNARDRFVLFSIAVLSMSFSLYSVGAAPQRAVTTENEPTVSVMTFNKLYSNDSYQQIINHIHLENPDILAFQEIYKHEAELLAAELGYEHWHIASCGCSAFGSDLAIFSKFPVLNSQMSFEDTLGGALRAEIELDVDSSLVIYNTHIVPPYKQKYYGLRGEMFEKLSNNVTSESTRTIVVGDFNASPTSTDLRSFAGGEHGLRMAAEQEPFSKCSWFGYTALFCARIDHVFMPQTAQMSFQRIGPNIGSDHRPVHVGILF